MKIAGIIAEYNPFHLGHAFQISFLRAEGYDAVVAVMSPSAVQRGSAAIMPTSLRVKAAIEGGADLVLCLPAPYALCSAEVFASAGVRALDSLGNVNALCFGITATGTDDITRASTLMASAEYKEYLRRELDSGSSYPAAAAKALNALDANAAEVLREANNLLGIEYCKAICSQNSAMRPLGIARKGAVHDEVLEENASASIISASALRALIYEGAEYEQYVPSACNDIYKSATANGLYINVSRFDTAVLSRLRGMDKAQFANIRGASEGLEHRLFASVQSAANLDELYTALKCKRYAHSRMRRLVLNAALGYTARLDIPLPYLHILGANKRGLEVLTDAKSTCSLPISSSLAALECTNDACRLIAGAHSACEDMTALCLNAPLPMGSAHTAKMYKK